MDSIRRTWHNNGMYDTDNEVNWDVKEKNGPFGDGLWNAI